jgi:uncharacterized repeat protein (TIGR01451 family)
MIRRRKVSISKKEKDAKMATFYNQATLSYGGVVQNSNITSGELISGVSLTKTAISTGYGPGDGVIYAVNIINAENTAKTGITLTDNLGAYTPVGGKSEVVPLTYVNGSLVYYQNGAIQTAPTVTAGPPLTISGIDIPANGNVTLLYEATANGFAPLAAASTITNTATATSATFAEPLTDTANVSVNEAPNLSIAKAVCPPVVNNDEAITYTFIVQNTGNLPVNATDDLVVSDTFNPVLNGITVTLNGAALTAGTDYTYDETTGVFTTLPGVISVPAATYTTDPTTGVITTTPGFATLTVTGTI